MKGLGTSYIDRLIEKYALDKRVMLVPVQCTSTVPFLVVIEGGSEDIPARRVAGTTSFGVGDRGMALWSPPGPLYCFKSVDTA